MAVDMVKKWQKGCEPQKDGAVFGGVEGGEGSRVLRNEGELIDKTGTQNEKFVNKWE
ncbi:MAG: hypothetical protein NTZ09_08530 [Candidatus Hydrogenedentes bacterium]|nr:hypothetical protein [Candidatus Hydrogenedentota bacterium]